MHGDERGTTLHDLLVDSPEEFSLLHASTTFRVAQIPNSALIVLERKNYSEIYGRCRFAQVNTKIVSTIAVKLRNIGGTCL